MEGPADNPNKRKKTDSATDTQDLLSSEFSVLESINKKLEVLGMLHQEIKDLKVSLEFTYQQISDLQQNNAELRSTLATVTSDVDLLKKENKLLKETVLDVQSRSMRDNLIISGIPESTPDNPEVHVKKFMVTALKIPTETVNNITFHRVHRLGPRGGQRPRPIIAKFEHYQQKMLVKSKGRELKGTSFGRKQCESASDEGASVPLRKVKAPLRKRNARARVNPEEKPSHSPEPPVETQSSTDERSGRRTRSSQRHPAKERRLYVDTVPHKQSEPEKTSTKKTHHTTRPSVRASGSKRVTSASQESVNDTTSASSPEEVTGRKKQQKEAHKGRSRKALKSRPNYVIESNDSLQSSEEFEDVRKRTKVTRKTHKRSKRGKSSSPKKPSPKLTQSSKKPKATKGITPIPQQQDEDAWTETELMKLQQAVSYYPKHMEGYWTKVARMVGTRSAEECHCQYTSQGTSQTPAKKSKKTKKENVEVPKDPDHAVISARAGTFKRKQQVRQFLEAMPRDDVEDVFSSAYMQNKRFEIPSICPSEHDFRLPDMEPLTPMSAGFPEVKTPQCLHITPGMMGSPSRTNDDKYVYQLQKRMKKNQFNVCKKTSKTKSFSPTPSVKRSMRRCGNAEDTFVVWEMFPGNNGALSDSEEEEDFYFSDNN